MFISGQTGPLQKAFQDHPAYWLRNDKPLGPNSPNGFQLQPSPEEQQHWQRFGLAELHKPADLASATDDWPFLYLREPMLPDLSLRGR